MTLLVLASAQDVTASRFAEFAAGSGVRTVVASGFEQVGLTVTVTRDRLHQSKVTVGGADVCGVLNRGQGSWGEERSVEQTFMASESYAIFWSTLALWPGPVVNRPSAQGFFPRLDPLELAGHDGIAPPPAVILNGAEALSGRVSRISDWTVLDPDAPRDPFDVVQITRIDPARTRHILVAGAEAFDLNAADGRLRADLAGRVAPVLTWLHAQGTDFAEFTVQMEPEATRLLDASCWPGHHQFTRLEEPVYSALLKRLAS